MTGAPHARLQLMPVALWLSGLLLIGLAWWPDAQNLAWLVWTRDTYNYGLWVPVISLWLIWRDRDRLQGQALTPWLGGAPVMAGAAILWLAGSFFDAGLLRHLALITALQGLTLVAFGPVVYRRVLFPMLFLYLMVPFGEGMIPPLQQLTADGTIRLLRLVGIPAQSDGVLITLPSGVYEVARACAGVQFLFTSLVMSVLMAFLAFRRWRKRAAMVLAGVLVPILANILRVFSILVISELTSQQFAKSIDHIVYGWVFLSFILLILIALAYRYADNAEDEAEADPGEVAAPTRQAMAWIAVLILLPLGARLLLPPVEASTVCPLPDKPLPACEGCGYRLLDASHTYGWPLYAGTDKEGKALYRHAGIRLQLYRALYSPERPGHRLSGLENRLGSDGWAPLPGRGGTTVTVGAYKAREIVLWRGAARRLVWQLQFVGGHAVTSLWQAKLWGGFARLRHGAARAAVLSVSTEISGTENAARAEIRNFLSTFPPETILWDGGINADKDILCAASAG
ncbi:exosortase A [Kordiimonas marina]|uniref:exosortase A n=1 Tax=Kordiimonas marina TaxID=2872312 RepID=UPI001FF20D02|nr:exosortase A [Kordiimonas marina]MCJ9430373.1 EpsI family protein [Kordiimonas marina]